MTRHAVLRTRRLQDPNGEPGVWRACAAVLDLVSPTADVIAVTPVGAYLAWRLRAAVAPERLFLHSSQSNTCGMRHPGEAEPVIMLGERERDLATLPRGLWPHQPVSVPARVRPLNLLYADSHKVGLLVLDAGDRTPEVLRGASRVLVDHAPLLLIDCAATARAEHPGLWQAIVAAAPGYDWIDVPSCSGTVAGGIPASRGIASRSPVARNTPSPLVAMQWKDRLRRVVADPIPNVSLKFDDALAVTGMYPAQPDGNGVWRRCAGLGSRATFYLPLPVPGLWRLCLQVAHWGLEGSPTKIRFYAGGIRLRQDRAYPDSIRFIPFDIPRLQSGAVLIEMITPAGAAGVALTHCIAEPAVP